MLICVLSPTAVWLWFHSDAIPGHKSSGSVEGRSELRRFSSITLEHLSMSTDVSIGRNTFVSIHYDLRDGRGNLLERTEDPAEFVWGYDTLLPALESALEGMQKGEVLNVTLSPEEAYGTRDEDGVFTVPNEEFPSDNPLEEGNEYTAEGEDGTILTMRVVEIHDDHVMVDTNHPLAGETLNFHLRVVGVREATDDEVLAARAEASEVGELFSEALPS